MSAPTTLQYAGQTDEPRPRLSKLAVASVVMALLSATPCLAPTIVLPVLSDVGLLPLFVMPVTSIVMGWVAGLRVTASGGKMCGDDWAAQGMYVSLLWLVMLCFFAGVRAVVPA